MGRGKKKKAQDKNSTQEVGAVVLNNGQTPYFVTSLQQKTRSTKTLKQLTEGSWGEKAQTHLDQSL